MSLNDIRQVYVNKSFFRFPDADYSHLFIPHQHCDVGGHSEWEIQSVGITERPRGQNSLPINSQRTTVAW